MSVFRDVLPSQCDECDSGFCIFAAAKKRIPLKYFEMRQLKSVLELVHFTFSDPEPACSR